MLQFIVLATAWNILGGYAGYVNFGTGAFFGVGAYTAVVLIKAFGAPLAGADPRRRALVGALLGLGVGLLTLRLRGIFFSIATVARRDHHRDAGDQLALRRRRHRPAAAAAAGHARRSTPTRSCCSSCMALIAVLAVAVARYIQTSWIGRGLRAIRDNEDAAECVGRADAQAQAVRLRDLRRADGRGRRADARCTCSSSSRPRRFSLNYAVSALGDADDRRHRALDSAR